ncbi:MAG: LPXTG cell wall anchor domain-containing protein, partial [Roseiflexaceae bacterium]
SGPPAGGTSPTSSGTPTSLGGSPDLPGSPVGAGGTQAGSGSTNGGDVIRPSQLPNTGDIGSAVPAALTIAALLFACGMWLRKNAISR